MGLIFALVAVGLTLIWGIMDIVDFAHGDFLMAGMYLSLLDVLSVGGRSPPVAPPSRGSSSSPWG